ncbi:MAG: hypothetical protein QOJ01_2298, partial [Solirubrobacterales bacterium]|nr:hypothetical protein [Solirubrobacterales bacterium]
MAAQPGPFPAYPGAMPAVTVIVPACDAEATIGRTLDALSAIEPKLAEVI